MTHFDRASHGLALLFALGACGAPQTVRDASRPDAITPDAVTPDAAALDADAAPSQPAALIRVHYPFGAHAVTLRGSGGGLTWTAGAPGVAAGADTVSFTLAGLAAPLEFKPLLDDATWSRGPNYHASPGATVDVYPHFVAPAGRVETLITSFASTHVASRAIYAYLPASYGENTDARYPVVYMHDGQNLWAAHPELAFGGTWNVDTAFDAAAEHGACSSATAPGWGGQPLGAPPTLCESDGDCASGACVSFPEAIVIGVANTADRIHEYTPTTDPGTAGGGGADAYVAMLVTELKPQVDAMLRTRPDAASTALAGSSLGGLVTAYAGLMHPEVFGALAELSPSSWWNGGVIVADVAGTAPAPARPRVVYVDSGAGDVDDESDTDHLAAQYVSLGYVDGVTFRHVVQPGAAHNESFWAQRFPGAMQLVLGAR